MPYFLFKTEPDAYSFDDFLRDKETVWDGVTNPTAVKNLREMPKGTKWKGLWLKAEIEVKGQRYPVRWACRQKLNEDGSLTLRQTVGLGAEDETGGVPRGPE